MPIYEYKCDRCAQVFERLTSRGDRDRRPACTACGSARTRRLMSKFAGRSSGVSVAGSGGCSSCSKSSCTSCRRQ
ncbi:MAG: zinc ribbon domain-containing protein [Armatimonadetes bacterium]|nr:zinc ribbon domain-containing protein [Armatimonadota bacterium]